MRKCYVLIVLLWIIPITLPANMATPFNPGDPVGEPSPLLDSIRVLHEKLTLDLRALPSKNPVRITASYQVLNAGIGTSLDLLFIAAKIQESGRGFSVWIDEVPVMGRLADTVFVPKSWGLPPTTPGFYGSDLPYDVSLRVPDSYYEELTETGEPVDPLTFPLLHSAILFSLYLGEGEHTIRVEYFADPSRVGDEELMIYNWQLGYVLAPAKDWGRFDSLDITLLLPKGWEARTSPTLEGEGDSLHGSWSAIPADALGITTRVALSPAERWFVDVEDSLYTLGLIFALLFPLGAGIRGGIVLARRGASFREGIVPVSLLSLGLGLIPYLMVGLYWWIHSSILGDQSLPSYSFLYLFLLVPFSFGGTILSLIGLAISRAVVRGRVQARVKSDN